MKMRSNENFKKKCVFGGQNAPKLRFLDRKCGFGAENFNFQLEKVSFFAENLDFWLKSDNLDPKIAKKRRESWNFRLFLEDFVGARMQSCKCAPMTKISILG